MEIGNKRTINDAPFCWQGKNVLRMIRQHFESTNFSIYAAGFLYVSLTELASNHSGEIFEASNSLLSQMSGLGQTTVKKIMPEFEKIGLIKILRRMEDKVNLPNQITLLGLVTDRPASVSNVGQFTNHLKSARNRRKKEKSIEESTPSLKPGVSKFIPLSLDFHLKQQKAGLHHREFNKPLTDNSKIIIQGAVTLEKIHRIDGESSNDIQAVLDFILNDYYFWQRQVVSLSNIRKTSKNGNSKYGNCKNAMLNDPGIKMLNYVEVSKLCAENGLKMDEDFKKIGDNQFIRAEA